MSEPNAASGPGPVNGVRLFGATDKPAARECHGFWGGCQCDRCQVLAALDEFKRWCAFTDLELADGIALLFPAMALHAPREQRLYIVAVIRLQEMIRRHEPLPSLGSLSWWQHNWPCPCCGQAVGKVSPSGVPARDEHTASG